MTQFTKSCRLLLVLAISSLTTAAFAQDAGAATPAAPQAPAATPGTISGVNAGLMNGFDQSTNAQPPLQNNSRRPMPCQNGVFSPYLFQQQQKAMAAQRMAEMSSRYGGREKNEKGMTTPNVSGVPLNGLNGQNNPFNPANSTLGQGGQNGSNLNPFGVNRPDLSGMNSPQDLMMPTAEELANAPCLNDFQLFVANSTGRLLPMYGSELFMSPMSFAPITQIPVPADYVVGPGDRINIRIWGSMDFAGSVPVGRDGTIFVPKVGNVVVAGLHNEDLSSHLKENLSRIFRNFELTATIGEIRTIQIYVTGHASRPGKFTVSSLSTLVNAIFESGGPSESGTMRRIELHRGTKTVTTLDLYDLIARGDISKDAQLQPGDIIYFPEMGSLVAVPDQVKMPAVYELNKEATIGDVVNLAGGFTTTAFTHEVTIESIKNRQRRSVERLSLDADGMKRPAQDGDILLLAPISPRFDNAVTLRGNVARSGRYPYKQGMHVHDLIPGWQSLISPDYWTMINRSSVKISDSGIPADVRSEGINVNWEYALIERLDTPMLKTKLIHFNLGKAVLDRSPEDDIELQPGDIVTVFSQQDLQVPQGKRVQYVTVEGEFNTAGVYRIETGETLPHFVERIGGFSPDAYPETLQLIRESLRVKQMQDLNQFITRMENDLQTAAANNVNSPDTLGNSSASRDEMVQLQMQRDLLGRLKATTPTGRLNMRLRSDKGGEVKLPEIQLQDGDHLLVEARPQTVSVIGMVFSGGDFGYRQEQKLADYIHFAGGFTRAADKSKIYIVGANGEARLISGGFFRGEPAGSIRPGDTIFVPQHTNPGQFMRDLKDWSQILGQFGISAAAIKVLMQ